MLTPLSGSAVFVIQNKKKLSNALFRKTLAYFLIKCFSMHQHKKYFLASS